MKHLTPGPSGLVFDPLTEKECCSVNMALILLLNGSGRLLKGAVKDVQPLCKENVFLILAIEIWENSLPSRSVKTAHG